MKSIMRMRVALLLLLLLDVFAVFVPPSFASVLANITPSPEPATATPIIAPTNTPIIAPTTTAIVPVATNTAIVPMISTPSPEPSIPSARPTSQKHRTDLDTPTPMVSVPPTEPPPSVLTMVPLVLPPALPPALPPIVPTIVPTIVPSDVPARNVPVSQPRPASARLPITGADDGLTNRGASWFLCSAIMLIICGYLIRGSKWITKHTRH